MIGASLILGSEPTKAVLTRAMPEQAVDPFLEGKVESRYWGTSIMDPREVGKYIHSFDSCNKYLRKVGAPREEWSLSTMDDVILSIQQHYDSLHTTDDWLYWTYDNNGNRGTKLRWTPSIVADRWAELRELGGKHAEIRGEGKVVNFLRWVYEQITQRSSAFTERDKIIRRKYDFFTQYRNVHGSKKKL